MKKYNAVIFDLDGVICHTDKYHYQAWKAVADELGIYFDEEINNRLRGVSRMESFEIILERYEGEMSEEEKECWTTKKNDIYKELLKNWMIFVRMDINWRLDHPVKTQDLFSGSWDLESISMQFQTEIIFQNQSRIRKYL